MGGVNDIPPSAPNLSAEPELLFRNKLFVLEKKPIFSAGVTVDIDRCRGLGIRAAFLSWAANGARSGGMTGLGLPRNRPGPSLRVEGVCVLTFSDGSLIGFGAGAYSERRGDGRRDCRNDSREETAGEDSR